MRRFAVVVVVACSSAQPAARVVHLRSAPAPIEVTAPVAPPSLVVIDHAFEIIADNYVDPARIDPKRMLAGALDGMQRDIPEVLADTSDPATVAVQVNDKRQTFAAGDVDSLKTLSARLASIFQFVRASDPGADFTKLEYAALNGMLASLDPHSTLLDPEEAREMDANVAGKFGGLGIVIDIQPDSAGKPGISITRLIDAPTPTPAVRAGLVAGDRIIAIDGSSTENWTIAEAIRRLRGDPDTKITLTIVRGTTTKQVELVRAVISVPSTRSELLPEHVGYLRIDQFSKGVSTAIADAMTKLRARGARGWVLDLRDNPGGLLDEAERVVDLFVDSGVMVTVVGNHEREEAPAARDDDDDHAPLVVLVDEGTVSAAEIVAGALRHLDRAPIVGRRSFGKGTVQMLFGDPDGSKLKLTIAQYLVGTTTSLQSVGITPDIELDRATIPARLGSDTDVMHLVPPRAEREADLDAHLTSAQAVAGPPAAIALTYVADPPPPKKAFFEDAEVRFARAMVTASSAHDRPQMLRDAAKVVVKARRDEQGRIARGLAKLGIDWRAGTTAAGLELATTIEVDKSEITAGDPVAITGVVHNAGRTAAYQVRARATADDESFDGAELVFGYVPPGATKRCTIHVRTPRAAAPRSDRVTWSVVDETNAHGTVSMTPLSIVGRPRPRFAYSYQLVEGSVQRGATVHVHAQIKNVGSGRSGATTATLISLSGDQVSVVAGRFELPAIDVGDTRDATFVVEVKPGLTDTNAVVELRVADAELGEVVTEKLVFPLEAPIPPSQVTPPTLALDPQPLETQADHVKLSGTARDDRHIDDAFVTVSNRAANVVDRKVFYLSNRGAADPTKLDLAASIPVWPGSNKITIVTRESDRVRDETTLWIDRR